MATDKGLLSIIQRQGLGCFVSMLQLQRGPRVGIDGFVMKLIMHAAMSTGSIKFYVGEYQEAGSGSDSGSGGRPWAATPPMTLGRAMPVAVSCCTVDMVQVGVCYCTVVLNG